VGLWQEPRVYQSNERLLIPGFNYGLHFFPTDYQAAAQLAKPMFAFDLDDWFRPPTVNPSLLFWRDMINARAYDAGVTLPADWFTSIALPKYGYPIEDTLDRLADFINYVIDPIRAAEGWRQFEYQPSDYRRDTTDGVTGATEFYPSARYPTDVRIATELYQSPTFPWTKVLLKNGIGTRYYEKWDFDPPGTAGCHGRPIKSPSDMWGVVGGLFNDLKARLLSMAPPYDFSDSGGPAFNGYRWELDYFTGGTAFPPVSPEIGFEIFYNVDSTRQHYWEALSWSLRRTFMTYTFPIPSDQLPTQNFEVRLELDGIDSLASNYNAWASTWGRNWVIEIWLVDPSLSSGSSGFDLWDSPWLEITPGFTPYQIGQVTAEEIKERIDAGISTIPLTLTEVPVNDAGYNRANFLLKMSYDKTRAGAGGSFDYAFSDVSIHDLPWCDVRHNYDLTWCCDRSYWVPPQQGWTWCVSPHPDPYGNDVCAPGCIMGVTGSPIKDWCRNPETGWGGYAEGISLNTGTDSRLRVAVYRWYKELVGLDFEP